VKICGLTDPQEALAIAALGVEAIGVIGVPGSPRFLAEARRERLFAELAAAFPACRRVLVLADPATELIERLPAGSPGAPTTVQLHGDEPPGRCRELRHLRPDLSWWKALRLRGPEEAGGVAHYDRFLDAVLLDAWHPSRLGGTGETVPLDWLAGLRPRCPWWLAGGVSPESVGEILRRVSPDGLDASSRLERAPGRKDLERVRALLAAVRC
jgi:phosphoribosylanthranilate isomerase